MVLLLLSLFFFFNDTATTEIYTLSLHDALPISGGMPDGEHGGGHGEVSALEPEPRRAPELSRGRRGIMVGNAREADEAPWIALAEARRPVVVDLVHRLDQLAVLHAQADPQDPVHHLGVDPVEVLVLQAQVRRGRVRAALVEPDLEHLFHVLRESPLHAVEAEPEAAKDSELLFFGVPARTIRRLAHLRDLVPKPRGRVLDPEIAGHPGHVDVAVGGNDAIAHRRAPCVRENMVYPLIHPVSVTSNSWLSGPWYLIS